MAAEFFARLQGIDELTARLRSVAPRLRQRVLRNALAAGARVVRDEARARTPVLSGPVYRRSKLVRTPGTVRRSIVVRTSKIARRQGDVGVFVNVRPAKGALFRNGKLVRAKQRGATSPVDPFYWRWLEFGRSPRGAAGVRQRVARVKRGKEVLVKGVRYRRALAAVGALRAYGFLRGGAGKLNDALQVFIRTLGPQLDKFNDRGRGP